LPSTINIAGSAFVEGELINSANLTNLFAVNILQPTITGVRCYLKETIKSDYEFNLNGFEFCDMNGDLLELVKELSQNLENKQVREILRKAIIPFMTQWGRSKGIDFDYAIPLDTVYRNTDPKITNAFRSVPFAHVDFSQDKIPETLQAFIDVWKPRVEESLKRPEMSTEEYLNLNIRKMVNIWINLNEIPSTNTLALLDTPALDQIDRYLKLYTAVRRDGSVFTAQILDSQPPQSEWVVQRQMQIGDAVIFNSLETPHTAADIYGIGFDVPRQSVELRVAFVSLSRLNSVE
jgi:hypothetical protein